MQAWIPCISGKATVVFGRQYFEIKWGFYIKLDILEILARPDDKSVRWIFTDFNMSFRGFYVCLFLSRVFETRVFQFIDATAMPCWWAPIRASSETQGQLLGSGEKAGRKFSSTGERAPVSKADLRTFKICKLSKFRKTRRNLRDSCFWIAWQPCWNSC